MISKGFWMGQTEVTQAAYQRVMRRNPSLFKGAKLPVENVPWDEARSYCQEADMRLPTEAEWEYAARAGSTGARSGDRDAVTWHNGNAQGKTHEVAGKQPNPWGLYDMFGNVWEWVADWYADYAPGNATDPQGPSSGTSRSVRGGSWFGKDGSVGRVARLSYRYGLGPAVRSNDVGVRCGGN
jgi:formylglycine-generating enzyme required for sulfatase activity